MQIGDKIGKLTIKNIYKKKYRICLCICDCGKEKEIIYNNLCHNTKSCGCIKKEQNKIKGLERIEETPIEERRLKYLYSQYKSHAKYNNRFFDLTKEEFKNLVFDNCFYCNQPPSNLVANPIYGGPFYYNGIDRIDSNLGYSNNNTISCCIKCNRAKMDMSYLEFKEWLVQIYNNFILK